MARVLIVEDDVDICSAWAAGLTLHGNHVQTAIDGLEGIEQIKGQSFDVILLDLSMPRLSGLDTLRLIRETQPNLPIVVVTALTDHKMTRAAINAGANDILFKPLSLNDLADAVTRHARSARNIGL